MYMYRCILIPMVVHFGKFSNGSASAFAPVTPVIHRIPSTWRSVGW